VRLKYKILLLAVAPLLLALALIAVAVQVQQRGLAASQRLQMRAACLSVKQTELRHDVAWRSAPSARSTTRAATTTRSSSR
jgi:two-component system, NarL family, sensor kinase